MQRISADFFYPLIYRYINTPRLIVSISIYQSSGFAAYLFYKKITWPTS